MRLHDVPVKLVRILVVLSGRFLWAGVFYRSGYISFCNAVLDLCRIIWPQANREPTSGEFLLGAVDRKLAAGGICEMERCVTSNTFRIA